MSVPFSLLRRCDKIKRRIRVFAVAVSAVVTEFMLLSLLILRWSYSVVVAVFVDEMSLLLFLLLLLTLLLLVLWWSLSPLFTAIIADDVVVNTLTFDDVLLSMYLQACGVT